VTGRPGERVGNELWLRCPHCGDSQKNKDKAHYSVNAEGLYHCLRCGAGGRLHLRDYLAFVWKDHRDLIKPEALTGPDTDWEDVLDELIPGPGYPRQSALDRFHVQTASALYDAFLSRNTRGDITGLCLADLDNRSKIVVGTKTLGWTGERLLSSPDRPLRIVEGPYDVLSDSDVCTYGLPTKNQLKRLKGHYLIICPDGDVWPDPGKRAAMLNLLRVEGPTILGFEVLDDGMDPDDVPYNLRTRLAVKEIKKPWAQRNRLRRVIKNLTS